VLSEQFSELIEGKVDNHGRPWDPTIHIEKGGIPVFNKGGTLKCRPFLKTVAQSGEITTEKAPVSAEEPRQRKRKRTTLGKTTRLEDRNPRPGYIRRWVNDMEGRVQDFIDNDWALVTDKGQTTSRGVGTNMVSRLMEIWEPWFKENQDAKRDAINTLEKQGNVIGEGEYSPKGKDEATTVDQNPLR